MLWPSQNISTLSIQASIYQNDFCLNSGRFFLQNKQLCCKFVKIHKNPIWNLLSDPVNSLYVFHIFSDSFVLFPIYEIVHMYTGTWEQPYFFRNICQIAESWLSEDQWRVLLTLSFLFIKLRFLKSYQV